MTLGQQRIAIGKACGFKEEAGCTGIIRWRNKEGLFDNLPDFLNDLNAMHEAEESSSIFKSWGDIERWLDALEFAVIGRKAVCRPDLSFVLRATSAQRAEAFLKTLGLWDDPAGLWDEP